MNRPVLKVILAVVLGIVAGMAVMMSLHLASTLVYPLPDGVSFMSQEPENVARLNAWFGTLPAGAFVLAIICHGLGCMAGAVVAMLISGRRSLVPALVVGVIFTACGVMNLSSIPHPSWFPFADLPAYLLLALVAGLLLKRKGTGPVSAAT
ncbi:MAG: hypothetical protein OER86_10190 [Phycisphaerae bacterium]|nr:hypothetical protein [Phycisphaerae bacterium]